MYSATSDLKIETRKRRHIRNEPDRPLRTQEGMDDFFDRMKSRWTNLTRRSADSSYNCFGMAFANRRTHVHEDALPIIFHDDEYRKIERSDAERGDIVIYRGPSGEIEHVAVILQRMPITPSADDDLLVLSQWGNSGEFIHNHLIRLMAK